MTFCLPPGEQCLGYPVAGPDNDLRPGHRRYNVVWYRPADEKAELQRLLTDDSGTTHTISIPPPLIRGEGIAHMRAAAERLLAPQFREIVRHDRRADPATDLRPRDAAHGLRPRGDHRRCRVRGATACRGRGGEGGGRRGRAGGARSRSTMSHRRCNASRRRGFRSGSASSSVRAISAPICRRRRPPRSAPAPSATAFPKRCWRRRRCSISCGSRAGERRPALNAAIPRLSGALAGIANPFYRGNYGVSLGVLGR